MPLFPFFNRIYGKLLKYQGKNVTYCESIGKFSLLEYKQHVTPGLLAKRKIPTKKKRSPQEF